jgi:hypothetical protein
MTERIFDLEKFIDREFEQELFEDLLRLADDSRILAIRAGGGMGKSSLLEKFQYRCRVIKPRIPVSLVPLDQLSDVSPLAVIRQIVRQLSAAGADFSTFNKNEHARMAGDFLSIRAFIDLDHASFRDAKDVHIRGINVERAERVSISGEIKTLTPEQDSVAQEASVSAFFADLDRYCANHTVVIMLDAYERCARQLQQWIVEHLLQQVCFNLEQRPSRLVMIIAGRELPIFEHHWSMEDCGSVVRSVKQMSTWERRHVEECLQVHGYSYTTEIIDSFYRFVQEGLPPSTVVQVIKSLLLAQRGYA